jgi:hypothetical protein
MESLHPFRKEYLDKLLKPEGQAVEARWDNLKATCWPLSTLRPVSYNLNKMLYVPNLVLVSWPIWSEHCNYCLSGSGEVIWLKYLQYIYCKHISNK